MASCERKSLPVKEKRIQKARKQKEMFLYQERLEVLYMHKVQGIPVNEVAHKLSKLESTCQYVIRMYERHGRINRLLNFGSKMEILKMRQNKKSSDKPIRKDASKRHISCNLKLFSGH